MQARPGWMCPPPWGQEAVIFPQQDQISFPPERLPEHHGPHLQWAININEETIPFPLKKTLPTPAQTCGRTLAWVQTIQLQSCTAFLQFTLAHCLKPFSKQWQHYLQDSYKTGFVRTKNNKAVLSLSFSLSLSAPAPHTPSTSPCQFKIQTHFLKGTCTCLFKRSQQMTTVQEPGPLSGGAQKSSKVASQHL